MPADFINAYVLGSVGSTGAVAGACATYLYNLRAAVEDIRSGRARVAVVGAAEAPLVPEVVDGYATMGALANIDGLRKLFPGEIDYRRASRPFGENCGFTLGEGSQWAILMDDELALELGAPIHGAVANVFVNADGTKKSISAPGPGNYLTMARALAESRAILGDESLRRRSFVQAHGSSTPQNRVTESAIFDRLADTFGIEQWPVCAVKAYLGHTVAAASGDQLITSLGIFARGIVPGITTIDRVADDVHHKHLNIALQHTQRDPESLDVAFLNSKGFGGNNATASVLAPHIVRKMLAKRHGDHAFSAYQKRNEPVAEKAAAYDVRASRGDLNAIYRFGEDLIDESAIEISTERVLFPGIAPVSLPNKNPFPDMV
jgi:acetoacetyl-[acyl-carrier protein] synthase